MYDTMHWLKMINFCSIKPEPPSKYTKCDHIGLEWSQKKRQTLTKQSKSQMYEMSSPKRVKENDADQSNFRNMWL